MNGADQARLCCAARVLMLASFHDKRSAMWQAIALISVVRCNSTELGTVAASFKAVAMKCCIWSFAARHQRWFSAKPSSVVALPQHALISSAHHDSTGLDTATALSQRAPERQSLEKLRETQQNFNEISNVVKAAARDKLQNDSLPRVSVQ